MAINEISMVPTNSGTAPNEPDEPTWSSRIAVCGLHEVPNTNSKIDTDSKKRRASNSTEEFTALGPQQVQYKTGSQEAD